MEELLGDMVIFKRCKYHNGIVGNHRLKMLVSNDSFSFCYNLIMEVITNEKKIYNIGEEEGQVFLKDIEKFAKDR